MPEPIEIWRPFRSGVYEASSLGRIRRAQCGPRNRTLGLVINPWVDRDGYLRCRLNAELPRTFAVHRVVAEAFFGPCPSEKQVNHLDGVKANNGIDNLEYVTTLENIRHATTCGLKARGERQWAAKLTATQVREIRRAFAAGEANQPALGRQYGVLQATISGIVRRRTWTHV